MFEKAAMAMTEFYRGMHAQKDGHLDNADYEKTFFALRKKIFDEMDDYYAKNPNTPPILLKSKLHSVIAENFDPVIFPENPFFFEMGLRESQSWGLGSLQPSSWLRQTKKKEIRKEHPLYTELTAHFDKLFGAKKLINLCDINTPFDTDHHTLGYTKLFKVGINGIIEEAKARRSSFPDNSEEAAFCSAVIRSCNALIKVAEKFADKAAEMLADCKNETERKYLGMIAECAKKIPAEPPTTFYEGLSMMLFTREAIGTLENMGLSNLGHADRLLGKLYEDDIKCGRLTDNEARELVYLWMMYTDIKFDLDSNHWPETSTCIQLGGCDVDGNIVFNRVTEIFIQEHHRANLVNPKLNCRYSEHSPREYLELIGKSILSGHNNFVLINDAVTIPGLIKSGVAPRDARLYVNGGCQETMIEGCGHTEGAALYVSMLRLFDLFLRHDENAEFITPIDKADTFEEFYSKLLDTMKLFFRIMADQRAVRQQYQKEAILCPLFSSTQKGCIESGKDYVTGGAKYNFSTVALVGLANVADSLYAVKDIVYDRKLLTLEELVQVLANNWKSNEELRNEVISLTKYGHGDKEADAMANRFLSDISEIIKGCRNERGGSYLPSTFVYYYHKVFARCLRATPDGRKKGDLMAMGCSPGQLSSVKNITDTLISMGNMDFTVTGGGASVLDVMLPNSDKLTPEIFASLALSCAKLGCPTLQPNVLSVNDLIAAKQNPESYKDLIVRISGLSAKFVALKPDVQDEIISRNIYKV